MTRICRSRSREETQRIGEGLAAEAGANGVILVSGELGSGKTVLAQGVAIGLGISPAEVQSPSYILVREHRGSRGRLIHADLYRVESGDLETIGLWEILDGPGVKVVEWAERIPWDVSPCVKVTIRVMGEANDREISISTISGRPGAAEGSC